MKIQQKKKNNYLRIQIFHWNLKYIMNKYYWNYLSIMFKVQNVVLTI